MLKLIVLPLIVVVGLFSTDATAQTQAQPYQIPEAYEIYATILPERWPVTVAHVKKLLILAETGTYQDMCLKPEGESVPVVGPVIANFIEVNKQPWLLQKAIQMDQPYEFIFEKEIDAVFSNGVGGWKSLYEKYPNSGGYSEFSGRVQF